MSNRRRGIQLALPLLATVAFGQNFGLSWYSIDAGGAVDLLDFAVMQRNFTGS